MSEQERSDRWQRELPALANALRRIGYDIEPPRVGDPPGRGIVARLARGEHTVLVAVDAAGRFRVEITWLAGEWPSRVELAGVPVRVVETATRAVTVAGTAASGEELAAVLASLGAVVDVARPDQAGPIAREDRK